MPPCLYPTNSGEKPKLSLQNKLSLMMDLGLFPESLITKPSQRGRSDRRHRTITISDFISKKFKRQIITSNDLEPLAQKLSRKTSLQIYNKRPSILPMSQQLSEISPTKSKGLTTPQSSSSGYYNGFPTSSSPVNKLQRNSEMNALDKIVVSCNVLLQDNKRMIKDIEFSSRKLSKDLGKFSKEKVRLA